MHIHTRACNILYIFIEIFNILKLSSPGGTVRNVTSTIPECLSQLLTRGGDEPGVERTALLGIKLIIIRECK